MGFLGGSKADSKENRLENNRARRKMRLTGLFFVRRSSSDLSKGYRLLAIILHRCPDPARTIRIRKRLALSEPTLIVSRCDFDAGPLGSYVDGISLRRTSIEESELLLRNRDVSLRGCYVRRATSSSFASSPTRKFRDVVVSARHDSETRAFRDYESLRRGPPRTGR